jgi:uncharacterized protein YbjT (DUF2867 family)
MSTFKSFAVIGAGRIGTHTVKALLSKNVSVLVLTRSSTKTLPVGAKSAVVDYEDTAAVAAALKEHNVEAVVSTINGMVMSLQIKLADAAKAAGVKLFAPSEFTMPTHGYTEGYAGGKDIIVAHLVSIGLPYARFYTGTFIGYITWLLDYSDGKVRIVGKGNTPASFTAEEDIGGFVAHVLTELPPSELENRIFRIQGDRKTLLEVAALFGDKATVEHIETFGGEGMEAYRTQFHHFVEQGRVSTGWDEPSKKEGTGEKAAGSSNSLWPGHQWKTIKDVLKV